MTLLTEGNTDFQTDEVAKGTIDSSSIDIDAAELTNGRSNHSLAVTDCVRLTDSIDGPHPWNYPYKFQSHGHALAIARSSAKKDAATILRKCLLSQHASVMHAWGMQYRRGSSQPTEVHARHCWYTLGNALLQEDSDAIAIFSHLQSPVHIDGASAAAALRAQADAAHKRADEVAPEEAELPQPSLTHDVWPNFYQELVDEPVLHYPKLENEPNLSSFLPPGLPPNYGPEPPLNIQPLRERIDKDFPVLDPYNDTDGPSAHSTGVKMNVSSNSSSPLKLSLIELQQFPILAAENTGNDALPERDQHLYGSMREQRESEQAEDAHQDCNAQEIEDSSIAVDDMVGLEDKSESAANEGDDNHEERTGGDEAVQYQHVQSLDELKSPQEPQYEPLPPEPDPIPEAPALPCMRPASELLLAVPEIQRPPMPHLPPRMEDFDPSRVDLEPLPELQLPDQPKQPNILVKDESDNDEDNLQHSYDNHDAQESNDATEKQQSSEAYMQPQHSSMNMMEQTYEIPHDQSVAVSSQTSNEHVHPKQDHPVQPAPMSDGRTSSAASLQTLTAERPSSAGSNTLPLQRSLTQAQPQPSFQEHQQSPHGTSVFEDAPSCAKAPTLVLDRSGTMRWHRRFETMKEYALSLLSGPVQTASDSFMLYTYNDTVQSFAHLERSRLAKLDEIETARAARISHAYNVTSKKPAPSKKQSKPFVAKHAVQSSAHEKGILPNEIKSTSENLNKARDHVQNLSVATGSTNALEALLQAKEAGICDAIWWVSDGLADASQKVLGMLKQWPSNTPVIHSVAVHANCAGERLMREAARLSGGTFRRISEKPSDHRDNQWDLWISRGERYLTSLDLQSATNYRPMSAYDSKGHGLQRIHPTSGRRRVPDSPSSFHSDRPRSSSRKKSSLKARPSSSSQPTSARTETAHDDLDVLIDHDDNAECRHHDEERKRDSQLQRTNSSRSKDSGVSSAQVDSHEGGQSSSRFLNTTSLQEDAQFASDTTQQAQHSLNHSRNDEESAWKEYKLRLQQWREECHRLEEQNAALLEEVEARNAARIRAAREAHERQQRQVEKERGQLLRQWREEKLYPMVHKQKQRQREITEMNEAKLRRSLIVYASVVCFKKEEAEQLQRVQQQRWQDFKEEQRVIREFNKKLQNEYLQQLQQYREQRRHAYFAERQKMNQRYKQRRDVHQQGMDKEDAIGTTNSKNGHVGNKYNLEPVKDVYNTIHNVHAYHQQAKQVAKENENRLFAGGQRLEEGRRTQQAELHAQQQYEAAMKRMYAIARQAARKAQGWLKEWLDREQERIQEQNEVAWNAVLEEHARQREALRLQYENATWEAERAFNQERERVKERNRQAMETMQQEHGAALEQVRCHNWRIRDKVQSAYEARLAGVLEHNASIQRNQQLSEELYGKSKRLQRAADELEQSLPQDKDGQHNYCIPQSQLVSILCTAADDDCDSRRSKQTARRVRRKKTNCRHSDNFGYKNDPKR